VPTARVKRSRRGGYVLRIPAAEREVLRAVPQVLRATLAREDPDDPVLRRLFPAAFLDDAVASSEFDSTVREDLLAQRMEAIATMERTLEAERLTEDELVAWLAAVNDLRLVLGVRLAVTEESSPEEFAGDPDREQPYALYVYLSYLEEDVVRALSSG
jgi:hypothetical protein